MTIAPLSVIIPTYRDGRALTRALSSVAQQSWQPAEVIVVDDAGKDDLCPTSLLEFSELPIKLVTLERNIGPGGARNAGIAVSGEPFIAFLDADDEWHPKKIEQQMKLMQAPGALAFCSHLKSFSQQDWPSQPSEEVAEFGRWEILLKNPASISTVMVRRDSIRYFFPEWYACEDYVFVAANLLSGLPAKRINLVLARADKPAFGASGLSAKMLQMQLGEMRSHRFLLHGKLIGLLEYCLLVPWALLKFARRIALHTLRAWRLRG